MKQSSIFDRALDPIVQAGLVLGAVLLCILGSKLVKWTGLLEISDGFPWLTSASFLLFFAMFNSIFSLSATDMNKYWGRSILSWILLSACSGGLAYLFSQMTIDEAGTYRWIFIVLTFGYLIFLSMIFTMKRIVEFAEREDWESPKKKR